MVRATLNDAILLAGGKKAITGKVNFIRINNDGSFEKRKFRYKNNAKRGSYKNPYLKNGDFIVIGKGAVATFNEVLGEIVGVPDAKVNAFEIIQDSPANEFIRVFR